MKTVSPNRRQFLIGTAAGIAALTTPRALLGSKLSRKPNVIVLLADDLGYYDLGCYGQKVIATPNIDAMASQGVRFTQCYSGSSVCAPARSCLLTGQHTGHTRVRWNTGQNKPEVPAPKGRVPLMPQDYTVADMLKGAGYATGIIGKWGLGEADGPGVPGKHGFDEWFGYLNQAEAHSYYPEYLWRNEEKVPLPGNANGARGQYSHDLFEKETVEFIRRHKDHPFFLYLAYTLPHGRHEIPDAGIYKDKDWPENAKNFAAMVSRLDSNVGTITALLKELTIDDSTVLLLLSDNGSASGWKGLFDSAGQLNSKKGKLYEGGIKVPMIVRFPGVVPKGLTNDTPLYFPDMLPTLATAAGIKPPATGIDGLDAWPVITGHKKSMPVRFMYWEQHNKGFTQASRWGKWKAYRPAPGEPLELYDLAADPGETTNVASANAALIQKFEAYFKTARTESVNWPIRHPSEFVKDKKAAKETEGNSRP